MTDEEKQRLAEQRQQAIDDAKRVTEFLADPAVAAALRRLEKQSLDDFDAADTDEKRRTIWAKTRALREFCTELKSIQQNGSLAVIERDKAEAAEARQRRANTRR